MSSIEKQPQILKLTTFQDIPGIGFGDRDPAYIEWNSILLLNGNYAMGVVSFENRSLEESRPIFGVINLERGLYLFHPNEDKLLIWKGTGNVVSGLKRENKDTINIIECKGIYEPNTEYYEELKTSGMRIRISRSEEGENILRLGEIILNKHKPYADLIYRVRGMQGTINQQLLECFDKGEVQPEQRGGVLSKSFAQEQGLFRAS